MINYTGNPTGTAAPAAQPDPDTLVVVAQPQDLADPVNAASVGQAMQALANEQAWEKRPTGAAPAAPTGLDAAYVQPIKAFRNARGQRRDFVDHRGFANMAKIKRWQEGWDDLGLIQKTGAGSGVWSGRWRYGTHVGPGAPQIYTAFYGLPAGPGSIPPYVGGSLVLETGNVTSTGQAIAVVEANALAGAWITEDADMALSVDVLSLTGGSGSGCEAAFGLLASAGDPILTGASTTFASTSPIGIAIVWRLTDTHWQLYTCLSAGSPTYTDLGITTGSRVRLEYQGASASDDGTPRVIVYVDGAPVKNFGVDLTPANDADRMLYTPFFWQLSTGGPARGRYGLVDFAAARFGGDIAY